MRPFVQHPNNHFTPSTPATSTPQQNFGGANNNNNMLPNLMQIQSQMGFVNPQQLSIPFDNNSANFNTNLSNGNNISDISSFVNTPNFNNLQNHNLGGSFMGSGQQIQPNQGFSPHNLNVLGFQANGQLSNLGQGNPNQFFGHNSMSNGQFGWQNQLPNMNQLGNMPLLNPAQVNALTQLLGCANQVAQAIMPQNAAFLGVPQLGFGQPNGGLQQSNFNQQLPVASQQLLPNVSALPSNHTGSTHLQGQSSNYQGNHGQKQGIQISNSSHHQNRNFGNQKREASNWRFQNSQGRQLHNPKGKHKFSNLNEGKGIINAASDKSANPPKNEKKRSLAMLYTEKDIQQWREARKKHYPSKCNVEKKLAKKQANADAADEAAKLRRQQLKDVLAKQVELGFEIPEIPSHYLLDPEHQSHDRDKYGRASNKGRFQNNGRFQNKFNREGKFDRKDRFTKRGAENDKPFRKHDRFAKRQRVEEDDLSKTSLTIKEPTLLQKLLTTDIKRDNSRLLQAFRFMVINSFFQDWPEKPLDFPNVIVKETGVESDVIEDKSCDFEGELGNDEDHNASNEKDGENQNPQEEGEITD